MRQMRLLLAAFAAAATLGVACSSLARANSATVALGQLNQGNGALASTSTATVPAPRAVAQTPEPIPTATPTEAEAPPTLTSITLTIPTALPSPTLTRSGTATPAAAETPAVVLLPTATPVAAVATATTENATVIGTATVQGAIEGTVIANRTQSSVRFFAEGSTYTLDPLRSMGLALARPTGVLNLFNCDAVLDPAPEGCFWDPYLLERDGFYEVVSGKDAGALVSLVLREAGAPPADQVWIQNRTGVAEEVYFGTQMVPLPAGGIQEFDVMNGFGVFYLRTCVASPSGEVCEWEAHSAEPGGYYALVEESFSGGLPGTTVNNLELRPVLGAAGGEVAATAVPTQPQTLCRLAVPALNVRSGPGLEFEIVKKVRSSEVEIASVLVVARTEDGGWLQVDERVATGGWVIAGSEYLACEGDVLALPVIPAEQLPATPTPLPIVVVPVVEAPAVEAPAAPAPDTAQPATATVPADGSAGIPEGLAQLTIQNSFDWEMRFTLDQRYRVQQGPSEYDLQPGQSVSLLVFPGAIEYSASSPWQELSGNAQVFLNPQEARTLFIFFYYDTLEEKWLMRAD